MAQLFDITTANNRVTLDAQRQGQVDFTVTNRNNRPLGGRAQLGMEGEKPTEWLTFAGEAERSFQSAGTEQYRVQIQAPSHAPAGEYMVWLDMVRVDNPDEDFVEGPTVTIVVPEPVEGGKTIPVVDCGCCGRGVVDWEPFDLGFDAGQPRVDHYGTGFTGNGRSRL